MKTKTNFSSVFYFILYTNVSNNQYSLGFISWFIFNFILIISYIFEKYEMRGLWLFYFSIPIKHTLSVHLARQWETGACNELPSLKAPTIDMKSFFLSVSKWCQLINEPCKKHCFLLVVNHGVDSQIMETVQYHIDLVLWFHTLRETKDSNKAWWFLWICY